MKELDLLKNAWKKEDWSFQQLSENDIYQMLHKKSSSIVKWILIISIIELSFWSAIGFFSNSDEYLKQINHDDMVKYFKAINFVNYIIIIGFIYLFYKNYTKISSTDSTKQLMKDILKTRKTVTYYVWYNLGMITLGIIIGFVIAFNFNPKLIEIKETLINGQNYSKGITVLALLLTLIIIVLGLFWLFYKLLYGIFLKKLIKNYTELSKME